MLEQFYIRNIFQSLKKQLLHSNLVMLTLRKKLSFTDQDGYKQEGKVVRFFKLILPPYLILLIKFLITAFINAYNKIKILHDKHELQPGEISQQFSRRRFEEHLQLIKLSQDELGFTNQVLYQQNKKTITYYLPVFVTNKIKNIQDVSVQSLTGNISCTMIINVCFQGLPEEIIKKLENSIIIQLNRGEAIKLEEDGISITVKREKKSNFLIFTLRKLFLSSLVSDTLWSPFELVELIISVTLNTVTIPANQLQKIEGSSYNPQKQYKISFNCMRNSDPIPISYAMDCVFGVYDLAQRKLETYYTKLATYGEIVRNYQEYLNREKSRIRFQKIMQKNKNQSNIESPRKNSEKNIATQEEANKRMVQTEKVIEKEAQPSLIELLAQSTMKRLSIRPAKSQNSKKLPPKVKYFQYFHFVIPLYKYPGNSLATIFIPIFLLALISLTIFFQQPELSGRIGAIATMILGYIALIPSIKQQLPPSSKITVIETVVYIETMCCLLCLYQSFRVDGQDGDNAYKFIWYQSYTFMLCLFTHISTFFFILGIYVVHKIKWQPSYNSQEKVIEIKPADSRHSWDNPYCDEVFIKFNRSIKSGKYSDKQRDELVIRPLKTKDQAQSKKSIDLQIKPQRSTNLFENILKFSEVTKKNELKSSPGLKEDIQIDDNQFSIPDPDLYYSQAKIKHL